MPLPQLLFDLPPLPPPSFLQLFCPPKAEISDWTIVGRSVGRFLASLVGLTVVAVSPRSVCPIKHYRPKLRHTTRLGTVYHRAGQSSAFPNHSGSSRTINTWLVVETMCLLLRSSVTRWQTRAIGKRHSRWIRHRLHCGYYWRRHPRQRL